MTTTLKPDVELARKVVGMSLPLMGTMAGNLLMMLVDRVCLAQYSSDTLAASGPAVFTAMTVITFFTATANLSRSCVAQAFGRSGELAARAEGVLGMLVAAGLGLILLSLSPLLGRIALLGNHPPAIRSLESSFLELSALFGAVMVFNVSISAYFNGIGKTKVSLYVGVLGQLVAALAIYSLVFGRFGLPELGIRGSALGTLVGCTSMLVCYLWQLPRRFLRDGLKHWVDVGRSALRAQVALRLRRGLASGMAAGIDELGNTSFVWLAAILGPVALEANNVNLTLNYLAIIPIIGLGIGCSVLCSNAIGCNDYDQILPVVKVTLLIEGAYVLAVSLAQLLTPTTLLEPFGLLTSDSLVQTTAVDTTRVLWTYSASFVFSMTGAAVLEGFGMTRFILLTRICLMWGLSLPLIYLATHYGAGDPAWLPRIWIIGSIFEFAIGCIYFWNIRQATRKRLNYLQVHHAT